MPSRITRPRGAPPMTARSRRWQGGFTVARFVAVFLGCTGIREDEFACEDAVSLLQQCGPGFTASNIDCTFEQSDSCLQSSTLPRDQHHPERLHPERVVRDARVHGRLRARQGPAVVGRVGRRRADLERRRPPAPPGVPMNPPPPLPARNPPRHHPGLRPVPRRAPSPTPGLAAPDRAPDRARAPAPDPGRRPPRSRPPDPRPSPPSPIAHLRRARSRLRVPNALRHLDERPRRQRLHRRRPRLLGHRRPARGHARSNRRGLGTLAVTLGGSRKPISIVSASAAASGSARSA